jgi:ribosomal protein S1
MVEAGQIVVARVTAVHDFGIDVEAGGPQGFIQPIEVSWKQGEAPGAVTQVGDEIAVLVYASTGNRFFASIKQAHPELDPWRDPSRFQAGSVHDGTVLQVLDWGIKIGIAVGLNDMVLGCGSARGYRTGERLSVIVESVHVEQRKLVFRTLDASSTCP